MPLTYDMRDNAAPLAGLEVNQMDMLRIHTGNDRGTGVKVDYFVWMKKIQQSCPELHHCYFPDLSLMVR